MSSLNAFVNAASRATPLHPAGHAGRERPWSDRIGRWSRRSSGHRLHGFGFARGRFQNGLHGQQGRVALDAQMLQRPDFSPPGSQDQLAYRPTAVAFGRSEIR